MPKENDPNPGSGSDAVFDLNKIPDTATVTLPINGKDVVVKVKDLPTYARQGYHYAQNMEEVKKLREDTEARARSIDQEYERKYEPQTRLMQYLEANPEKRTMIRMIVNDEGRVVPVNGQDDDAPTGPSTVDLARLEDRILERVQGSLKPVLDELGTLKIGVGAMSERAQDQAAVDYLNANPTTKNLVSEERLADAREYKRKHGGDLINAFKNVTFEDAMNFARSKTIEEYGIDTESRELPGSRPPVVGNLVLDEKTVQKLFGPDADPDDLAEHAKAIRAHRRKQSGKGQAIRSSRR
jgi:hypothetical protein